MPEVRDTIAAIATPPGRGGIGVLRVSGPAAQTIGRRLCGTLPPPRQASLRKFMDTAGEPLDQGLALLFPAPHSYTGEDVLELHAHGGPVVLDLLLQRVLALGARLARPGEFSERAFLNDKLDLAQAEAVADLIDSGSAQAARAALRSLRGEFSARVHALVETLTGLRVYVEAALDFPDEELDFLSDGKVAERLAGLRADFAALSAAAAQGSLLREGMTVVIAGRPNAGKSSLLNRLAGHDAAIVTEIPGTTRDVLRERISLDGLPLHIVDTAGLRESADRVEQEGVRRAWREIGRADRVLLVVDDTHGLGTDEETILARLPAGQPLTLVFNKCDLSGHAPGQEGNRVWLSAKTGAGIESLTAHLKRAAGFQTPAEDSFIARRRHLDALERAHAHLLAAEARLGARAAELLAEELRLSQQIFGEITGEVSSEDLLGRIFSSFCIGK